MPISGCGRGTGARDLCANLQLSSVKARGVCKHGDRRGGARQMRPLAKANLAEGDLGLFGWVPGGLGGALVGKPASQAIRAAAGAPARAASTAS